ncbi:MAG: sulfite exporter TauE/SafE family protein [Deltaproteobacteria bacterium]|nr:sulfite exporter TauE/SafE family protein [Deltaproteobacteria bacterium]
MEQIPFIAAFLGGLLAFFSPCVIPLIPVYLSYLSGVSVEEMQKDKAHKWQMRRVLLVNALFFCGGFTVVFVLLGASASFAGQFLLAHLRILNRIAGLIIIILGLNIAGFFKFRFIYYEKRFRFKKKSVGIGWSFLAGIAFAFGWTPCVGPILAGILAFAATKETLNQGILLLCVFSLGMALPFMATALLVDLFRKIPMTSRILRNFEITSGIFLIGVGVLIFTNDFQALAAGVVSGLSGILEWVEKLERTVLPN